MNFLKRSIVIGTLLATTPSFAGDWTPLLKGMQQNCEVDDKIYEIFNKTASAPKALKADIVKQSIKYIEYLDNGKEKVVSKKQCQENDACVRVTTLSLKNAKAFGLPITEIFLGQGYEYSEIGIKFTNKDYEKILPNFHFSSGDKSWHYGEYFAQIYDHKTEQHFEVPYKDIKKYKNDKTDRYSIFIESTPESAYWESDFFKGFEINKAKNTVACSSSL